MKIQHRLCQALKEGFIYYCILTAVITALFIWYIIGSQELALMDPLGWSFYITSCISHAACIALIAYLVYILISLTGLFRVAKVVMALLSVFLVILGYINGEVYQIYRFHINGFVINMITGPGATQIFTFDIRLYLLYGFYFLLLTAAFIALWRLVKWLRNRGMAASHKVFIAIAVLLGSTLYAHVCHIFASFYQKPSVVLSARLLPYYFPTTSYGLLVNTLHIQPPKGDDVSFVSKTGNMVYPLHPITIDRSKSSNLNIVLILIDSWSKHALTQECMPNIFQYAQQSLQFNNHVSGSNGTKSGVFSLVFSISSYYWDLAESSHTAPVLLDVAHDLGYSFHNYPSACQLDPPFGRVLFAKEKNVRISTPGNTVYERDERITRDFISDVKNGAFGTSPFISILFYDLPHSFEPSTKHKRPFSPAWDYAKYNELNNDIDAMPFWNLYRNTCYQDDELVGQVFAALKQTGLDKNTVVVITGDHAQEFNENHKNYWGHNGNFSPYQIAVPLIVHFPDSQPQVYTHRTTHYDVVPTLMRNVLGVTNPESDYSMGHQLTDAQSRNWHIVGSELNYAFIVDNDTILEKSPSGKMLVYDSKMNLVPDYHINVKAFNEAINQLNRFIK